MLTRCLALAIAIASTTAAYGGTGQENYEKLWSKRAIDAGDNSTWQKPKAACVCRDAGTLNNRLGAFATAGTTGRCGVPTLFDSEGNVIGIFFCFAFDYIGN